MKRVKQFIFNVFKALKHILRELTFNIVVFVLMMITIICSCMVVGAVASVFGSLVGFDTLVSHAHSFWDVAISLAITGYIVGAGFIIAGAFFIGICGICLKLHEIWRDGE
jgi:fructose-specific phosphotransferase system IIC component